MSLVKIPTFACDSGSQALIHVILLFEEVDIATGLAFLHAALPGKPSKPQQIFEPVLARAEVIKASNGVFQSTKKRLGNALECPWEETWNRLGSASEGDFSPHSRPHIHRDVKSANVLVTPLSPMLDIPSWPPSRIRSDLGSSEGPCPAGSERDPPRVPDRGKSRRVEGLPRGSEGPTKAWRTPSP